MVAFSLSFIFLSHFLVLVPVAWLVSWLAGLVRRGERGHLHRRVDEWDAARARSLAAWGETTLLPRHPVPVSDVPSKVPASPFSARVHRLCLGILRVPTRWWAASCRDKSDIREFSAPASCERSVQYLVLVMADSLSTPTREIVVMLRHVCLPQSFSSSWLCW